MRRCMIPKNLFDGAGRAQRDPAEKVGAAHE
jgi:hypothetical protein